MPPSLSPTKPHSLSHRYPSTVCLWILKKCLLGKETAGPGETGCRKKGVSSVGGTLRCCDVTGVGKASLGVPQMDLHKQPRGRVGARLKLQGAAGADEGADRELSTHTHCCSAAGQLLRDYCPLGCPAGFSKVTLLEDCFWPRVTVYGVLFL